MRNGLLTQAMGFQPATSESKPTLLTVGVRRPAVGTTNSTEYDCGLADGVLLCELEEYRCSEFEYVTLSRARSYFLHHLLLHVLMCYDT